jgi:hypothetical protein
MLLYVLLQELARFRQAEMRLEVEQTRLVAAAVGSGPPRPGPLTNLVRWLSGLAAAACSVALHWRSPSRAHPGLIWKPCDSPVPRVQRYPWGPPV